MARFALPLVMAAAALGGGSIGAPTDPRPPDTDRGALLFRIYCANCHGSAGRGDGPTAEVLKLAPADLTRLSADNGGEFPRERLYKTIDGREPLRGHGQREMPIWGLGFQELDRDVDQEAEVREKILALLDYLETLQR